MGLHIALVRNVMQGREGLTGEVMRDAVEAAGGTGATTYRSTGNVVFASHDGAAVCRHLGAVAGDVVGRDTPVFHRTAEDLRSLLAARPFRNAPRGAAELVVVFTDGPLRRDDLDTRLPAGVGAVHVHRGRDVACWRTDASGPHPTPFVERLVGAPATARSVGTVEGLGRLLDRLEHADG